jgi:hypothetical protein
MDLFNLLNYCPGAAQSYAVFKQENVKEKSLSLDECSIHVT